MTNQKAAHLEDMALRVREHIVRMAVGGGAFVGAAMSCADLLVFLYGSFLNVDPERTQDPQRDYFFLSKGHAVPALYGVLAERGFISTDRLANHLSTDDSIYWHPNRMIPGVEFHSGSLGHGLPVAVGVALDCKLCEQSNRVVVMVGDGELNEGSNWEACLVASAYGLDNLIIVVDRNGFQANLPTESLIPLEPLVSKLDAFGCRVIGVNGHDYRALDAVFRCIPFSSGKPIAIIAETVRGCGIPSIERRADRWMCNWTREEAEEMIAELHRTHAQSVKGPRPAHLEMGVRHGL